MSGPVSDDIPADLVADGVERICEVLQIGSSRHWDMYSPQYHAAKAIKHLAQFLADEGPDEDSGRSHLDHAGARVLLAMGQEDG